MTPDHDQPNGGWRDIASAPRDGTSFLAFSQDVHCKGQFPLPSFISACAWHEDAGFCTDELREPTHWMPWPEPPHDRKPSSENRQEVSSSKGGML